MKKNVTIVDVARKAHVSIATASRVMNKSDHPVSEATRRRVLRVVAEMDFEPSQVARALAKSRTCMVGVIVGDTEDPYFSAIVRGIEDVARENGYIVIVCNSDRIPQVELTYVRTLLNHRVDGLIFAGGGLTDAGYLEAMGPLLAQMRRQGVGVVVLSEHLFPAHEVTIDNRAAARDLTCYLIAQGHREIGMISGPAGLNTTRLRTRGYRDALKAAGLTYDPARVISGRFRFRDGQAAMEQFFAADALPTAILAANDEMAVGAMVAVKRHGLRIPDDLSLVGFDDILATQYVDPPLTTLQVPFREMGATGMRQVLRLLHGEQVEPVCRLPYTIIERQSVRRCR